MALHHVVEALEVLVAVALELRESICESERIGRLAGEREADHHDSVADEHRLEELDDLGDIGGDGLQPVDDELPLNGQLQCAVVDVGDAHAREEILDERHKERHIVVEELGEVGVAQRANEGDVLRDGGVLALERAGHHEHRLDGAHAKVVVVLLRELLGREAVQLRHLLREGLGLAKAL